MRTRDGWRPWRRAISLTSRAAAGRSRTGLVQSLVLLLRLEFGLDLLSKSSTVHIWREKRGGFRLQGFVLYYCCFVWPVSRSVCLATATSTQRNKNKRKTTTSHWCSMNEL